ncbi:MAG: phosphatidate cytidylyltransferase [Hyphomicrobium sp.]
MPDNLKPEAEPPGAPYISKELQLRVASGVAVGLVALAMAAWSPLAFAILTLAMALAMTWEWSRIVRGDGIDAVVALHALGVIAAVLLTSGGMAGLGVAAAVAMAIAVGGLSVGGGAAVLSGIGVLYTGLPVVALGWLRGDEPLGFLAVLFVLIVVVATDTAAYAAGRMIGGPRLAPAISPNKTWSGLCGGVLAAALAGALFPIVTGSGNWVWLAALGFVLGLVAQAGDLAESALKRQFGRKDASDLIPGHGGVMDRMDGVVTAAVAAALIALAIDAYAPARALLYGS